ncbi:M23 family metallopeptidase [Flavobacterium ovatum]|uniref:M23 family metallopeptidase n=1 Tax=Flavobacterium ovatum TaxID=1928857 RepID=UPI00344E5C7D
MKFYSLLLLFSTVLLAQNNYPKDYFGVPLDIPMQVSGNFAELRPNHFHAGFDLRTNGREGAAVHAVADGFVSRIKISPYGNGSAVYIDHPNGFTSVYCHLQKTEGPIADFIHKAQYNQKSFEVEMFPKANELVVKKGEIIALTGNTGSSEGPHLHFEFRDTKTEKIINPLHFGYDKFLNDTRKPTVAALYVYPVDDKTSVNQSKRPIMLNLSLQKDGTYLASKVSANGKIGFGITADDYDAVSKSKNGIYKIQSYLNGKPSFGFQMDTYSFDEMRYINALIDYPKYRKTGQRVQKLFMSTPYPLSIIKTDNTNGVVTVRPNLTSVYRIDVADFHGNTTTINVPISFDTMSTVIDKEPVVSNYFVKVNRENIFTKNNWSVFFPAGTFYDNFDMNFDVRGDSLYLHDEMTPVHSSFTITVEDSKYPEGQSDKVFIADIDSRGRTGYNGTSRKGNVFTAKVKSLGKYTLATDTTKPSISIGNSIEGKWLSSQKSLQLSISDSGSGIKSYNGYLNGVWALFEYDYKTRKIIHDFSDGIVAEGANDLKVIVTDNVGNSTTFETRFYRSQK